uniref:DUF4794 domain-containing protein n=1 Tax=Dendroctonus ponderosae TaxID=77166 RepID=A0AAR5P0L2_DENPD
MQLELIFLLLLEVSRGAPNDGFPILNPGGIGGIFKGPDSETIIRGPDGSQISSEQTGGSIVSPQGFAGPIVAADAAISSEPPLVDVEHISSPLPVDVKPIEIVQQDLTLVDSGRIDLGQVSTNSLSLPDVASGSVPEVEYSSSFGVLHAQELPASGRLYASTDLPPAASTLFSATTAGHLLPPDALAESTV